MLISFLICSKNIPGSLFLLNTNCTYLSASQFCTIDRHALNLDRNDKNKMCNMRHLKQVPWFVRVLGNLERPGILLWHFPGLESPGKRPLVLESSGDLLNSTKNMKCMEGTKEN